METQTLYQTFDIFLKNANIKKNMNKVENVNHFVKTHFVLQKRTIFQIPNKILEYWKFLKNCEFMKKEI